MQKKTRPLTASLFASFQLSALSLNHAVQTRNLSFALMRKLFTQILKHSFIAVIQFDLALALCLFLTFHFKCRGLHWKMIVSVTFRLLEKNKVQSGYLELRLR